MSRFRLPSKEITFSKFTPLRDRAVHYGTDYPNSLHGFISHALQMTNQVSIPNLSLLCFVFFSEFETVITSIRLERRSLDRRLRASSPATHASLFNATIPNHKFSFKSRASDADRSNEIVREE